VSQSRLRLIRTGGLHAITVACASPQTINLTLAFSLFSWPARVRSLDLGKCTASVDRNRSQ
jgi:hypothetical protein